MRISLSILCLLALVRLSAQPLPVDSVKGQRGHYIFAVYTPVSPTETTVWACGDTKLTTHRLTDGRDSSEIILRPVPHTSLRTYVSTEENLGANAGAEEVIKAGEDILIGELLHYPALLSPEQRQLTESYLAIRHGLTLDQNSPLNYLALHRNQAYPVWTATAEPEYRNRIIGLARDDAAGLERLSGHSVLAPKLLALTWSERPATTAYLLLADNGAPTARAAGERTLQRSWRAETTGEIPPTSLSFDTRKFYDRAQPGEQWTLVLERNEEPNQHYIALATTDAQLVFKDVAFPTDGSLAFRLEAPQFAPDLATNDFFTAVSLSPNPVKAGSPVQLRAALGEPAALTLAVYDALGRLLEERRLPQGSHHLTEVTFPASGSYTLHLRSRQMANTRAVKILVH